MESAQERHSTAMPVTRSVVEFAREDAALNGWVQSSEPAKQVDHRQLREREG